ncbi:hypothetical protein [Candidatus Poriferisocius sp.]|uniref:hypothetical protein n=1 Tax=Candidatus Poriferisocius sp. TaxID=3101276 RepID=UPI003B52A657
MSQVKISGRMTIVRTCRKTGEVLGTEEDHNDFQGTGLAEIAKRFINTGKRWTTTSPADATNGLLSINIKRKNATTNQDIADRSINATSATVSGQTFLATFVDDNEDAYKIDNAATKDGLQIKLDAIELSHLDSPTADKPAGEDWTFRWEVSFALTGTNWKADSNLGRSMARRLLGSVTAGPDVFIHPLTGQAIADGVDENTNLTYTQVLLEGHQGNNDAAEEVGTGSNTNVVTIRRHRARTAVYAVGGDRIQFNASNIIASSRDTTPDDVGAQRYANFTYTITFTDT